VTGTAHCARCGTPMPPPTGRAARKRYCGESCRKTAWRDRHRDHGPDEVSQDLLTHVLPNFLTHVVPNVVPGVVVPTPSRDEVATPGSQHRCPHCRQPLAIISVVIPAGAAVIPVPEPPITPSRATTLSPQPGEDDLATLGNFSERQQGRAHRHLHRHSHPGPARCPSR
jgi:hypothetical protein